MTINPIKFIYFDVGMVLYIHPTQINLPKGYSQFEPELIRWIIKKDQALCRGDISLENVWSDFCVTSGFPKTVISSAMRHMISQQSPRIEMHEFVNQLRKHYQIGILTNMYSGMLPLLIEAGNIPPADWYSAVIDSSEVRANKPEQKIYEIATQMAGVKPAEIAFVDDRLENVEAAQKLGWTAWHFNLENPDLTIKEMTMALL